jgi:Glycosyl hydrolase family 9
VVLLLLLLMCCVPVFAQFVCKTLFWLSTLLAFGALVLIWLFFPSSYDYGRALGDSHYFFKTQRVGRLPANNGVSWRADALLQEEAIKISTSTSAYDLSGGYMTVRTCAARLGSSCTEAC